LAPSQTGNGKNRLQ